MPSRTHLPEPLPSTQAHAAPQAGTGPGVLALRLATVPDGAPPYDCETHGAGCPAVRDATRTSPQAESPPPMAAAPAPAIPADSPAAAGTTAAWPRQFAQVVVEILAGSRSARQINPWTTDRARMQLRRLAPLLVGDRGPKIQRVVTSRPSARVVEMTVVVNFGLRTRALAMRFEHVAGRPTAPGLPARPARWLCTEIEAG
jgi:hypothetical protein